MKSRGSKTEPDFFVWAGATPGARATENTAGPEPLIKSEVIAKIMMEHFLSDHMNFNILGF